MPNRITLPYLILGMALAGGVVAVACDQATAAGPTPAMAAGSPSLSAGQPGSSTGSSSTPTAPGNGTPIPFGSGTLSLLLKDSPFSEASALLVTFTGVVVHKDDGAGATADAEGEWVPLTFIGGAPSRTCDLKRLVASTDVLGTGPLPAGHYTQVRLTVSEARLYNSATTAGPACDAVLMPSPASDKGVPVNVTSGTLKLSREFDVPAGGAAMMLLDFDGDGSVHKTGNGKYMMTPVIRVVSVQ